MGKGRASSVTAFVRSPAKITRRDQRLTVVKGLVTARKRDVDEFPSRFSGRTENEHLLVLRNRGFVGVHALETGPAAPACRARRLFCRGGCVAPRAPPMYPGTR